MPEFLLELYSEEIPPQLQISARNELKMVLEKSLESENLKYKSIFSYSTPTRLTVLIKDIPEKTQLAAKEIKGPKVGVLDDILNRLMKAHSVSRKDIFEKDSNKGKFYFIKTKSKEISTKDLLTKVVLTSIASLSWKKSMKWADKDLFWGRPLRAILAIYNKKILPFSYGHLRSTESTIIEKDLNIKYKKIKNFNEYQNFLKKNKIILDQKEREKKYLKNLKQFVVLNILNQFLIANF